MGVHWNVSRDIKWIYSHYAKPSRFGWETYHLTPLNPRSYANLILTATYGVSLVTMFNTFLGLSAQLKTIENVLKRLNTLGCFLPA